MKNIKLLGTNSLIVFLIVGLITFTILLLNSFTSQASNNRELEFNNTLPVINVTVELSNYNGYGVSSSIANNGFINLTVTGGTAPYSYIWSNGEVTQDVYNLDGGNYGVYIIDFLGEEFSATYTLSEPAQQLISLPVDWSIISTYIQPVLPGVEDFFSPINTSLIFVKNGLGSVYWPQYSVNMIGNITVGEGYLVKTSIACDLLILGEVLQPELEVISLPISWSIIGYIRTDPAPIIDMLLPITNEIEIVKNYLGMVYWPSMNLDLIGDMIPGQGYQINMLSAQTFSYPENDIITSVVSCPSTLTDYDGNVYNVVQIGNQCWMSENLKVTHYSDGSSMIDGANAGNVSGDYTTKYYFDYNDNPLNTATYGKLYSWAAMLDGSVCGSFNPEDRQGVCPDGWHVPDNSDWSDLQGTTDSQYGLNDPVWDVIGDIGSDVGGNLKANMSNWSYPNVGATNASGFSGLPAGYRYATGAYLFLGDNGYFWSSQANCLFYGWYRELSYNKSTIKKDYINKGVALSVRCIKD